MSNSIYERITFSLVILLALTTMITVQNIVFAQQENLLANDSAKPLMIKGSSLRIEQVARGLEFPTAMAFVGPDDILVLEKNSGSVRRIVDGKLTEESLLDVKSAQEGERGMLGIAVSNDTQNGITHTYAFIYFTQSSVSEDGSDDCPPAEPHCKKGTEPLGNRLYRYELVNDKLVNPKLLLDLPATPGPNHNGGVVLVGPDECVYIVLGDLTQSKRTLAQNAKNGSSPDGTSGILRINSGGESQDASSHCGPIVGNNRTLNKYYAYGIRNSFGMDFDPVTGKLWDTENGPFYGDEINLVEPGFNSGWSIVQGIWKPKGYTIGELQLNPNTDLVNFNGKGIYSLPELASKKSIGVTALKFLDSDRYGEEYVNDMFVGDFKNGKIYHFDLNNNRTDLAVTGRLQDKIADTSEELDESNIVFAQGFAGITDLEVGPYDGYLYILSYHDGALYRIVN